MDTQDAADQFEAGYASQPTETPVVAKEPETKPEAAKGPEQKPDSEVKPGEGKKTDPLAEALARMDKLQASNDKLAGHIGRLERSYREIQANLATAQAAAKTVSDAPTQGEIKTASEDPEEWATLKAQYPQWAAATERMVDARAKSFDADAFEQKVNAAIDGKTAEMQSRIIESSLNAVFPGWKKTVATPEFVSWMDAQPEDVKAIRYSDDVGDVATVLQKYKESNAAKATPDPQPSGKQEPSPREKRLAAAVAPKGTGGHPPGRSDEDEFEAGYSG